MDAPIANEVLGRRTRFQEPGQQFLRDKREPVEGATLRRVDEAVCSLADDGRDAATLAVGDGRLVPAVDHPHLKFSTSSRPISPPSAFNTCARATYWLHLGHS